MIIARFHPQAWVSDNAVDADAEGEREFDVTATVEAMGREAALKIKDNDHVSDNLRFSPNAPNGMLGMPSSPRHLG